MAVAMTLHGGWNGQERFFDEDEAQKHHRYQYLPFGAGPRMCLGAGFASVNGLLVIPVNPLSDLNLPLSPSLSRM